MLKALSKIERAFLFASSYNGTAEGSQKNCAGKRKGSLNRMHQVLLTASIAIFSLMPMLFASGTGSEIQNRLQQLVAVD